MAPWLAAARRLPAEDAVVLDGTSINNGRRPAKIAVPRLSRIANFDDFDPLQHEPSVDFSFIRPGAPLPGDADLIILPGTKATLADLAMLRREGWDIDIAAHVRRGGRVLGLCGGYQMLGRRISDPMGVEGPAGEAPGLGLLDVETVLTGDKVLRPAQGRVALGGGAFEGYEMHVGRTHGPDTARPFLVLGASEPHGATSANGQIAGVYVHGLFRGGEARTALLSSFGVRSTGVDHATVVEAALDDIAATLEQAFDITALAEIAGLPNHQLRNRP
jgi:adenosylcobyric acid synthase